MSLRRNITTNLQQNCDVLATSWRRLGEVLATSWRQIYDETVTSWRQNCDVLATSWRRIYDETATSWRRIYDETAKSQFRHPATYPWQTTCFHLDRLVAVTYYRRIGGIFHSGRDSKSPWRGEKGDVSNREWIFRVMCNTVFKQNSKFHFVRYPCQPTFSIKNLIVASTF